MDITLKNENNFTFNTEIKWREKQKLKQNEAKEKTSNNDFDL